MLLELNSISKQYRNPGTNVVRDVLLAINLKIDSGDAIAIVGPSGAGKSTLLNIMGTLDAPTSGKILFKNQDLSSFTEVQLASIRNKNIGFVFQIHHLLPQLSLIENVLLPVMPIRDKKYREDASGRAMDLLKRVGLEGRIHQRPGQLSGGECQRAALVRALINSPELLLADEPTGSLDRDSAAQLSDLLVQINRDFNVALVVVTHSLTLAEKMNVIYRLDHGKLN